MKVNAIVLAGGTLKNTDKIKALIKIGEKTLPDIVIDALDESSGIGKIIVTSAPPGYKANPVVSDVIEDTGDLVENIARAIDKVEGRQVLLVSSDIPLLAPQHVSEFLDLCSKVKAQLYYPLIPKSAMGRLGSMKRTYFKLDRTDFTGGNIMLLDKQFWLDNLENAGKIYAFRKSPLKLAKLVGPLLLLKIALGRLSVSEVERKSSTILDGQIKGIIIRYPEIGSDVDKEEDLQFMQRTFETRK